MRAIVLAISFLFSGIASGQTVFKCVLADGKTHYQQQACPDTASHAEEKRINAPRPAASVDVFRVASGGSYRPDARITMLRGVEESDLRFELQGCINSVSARAYASVGPRIQSLENQKLNLLTQTRRASNNMAGASWEAGMRSQIGGIDTAIATERAGADAIAAQFSARCQDESEVKRKEMQERYRTEDETAAAADAEALEADADAGE